MKKVISLLLIFSILLSVNLIVSASDIIATESFEVSTAANTANEFKSSAVSAESKENIIIHQTGYRFHDGKYALLAEQNAYDTIEIKTSFFDAEKYADYKAIVELWLCADQLSNGESEAKIPLKIELDNGEKRESVTEDIRSDADFNGVDNGFVKYSVSADVTELKNAALVISVGSEDCFPKYVYIDDLKVTYEKQETEENTSEKEPQVTTLFRTLGIINDNNFKHYSPEKLVTRADFASIMSGFLKDNMNSGDNVFDDVYEAHYAYDDIKKIRGYGYMSGTGDNKFEPDEPLEYRQAVTVMVKMLGFSKVAESNGGYPKGYLSVATSMKLLNNIEKSGTFLTQKGLITLLEKFVKADYAEIESIVGPADSSYKINISSGAGATIMTEVFDLYYGKGVMTSTKVSGISDEGMEQKGDVAIDGVEFSYSGAQFPEDYLGYNVEYWYSLEGQIISFYKSNKNKELIIDGSDYIGIDGNNIKYSSGGRTKSISIYDCNVIYNGVFKRFEKKMLDFVEGSLKFVDNDSDGKYELLFIESYDYMVVNFVNNTDKIISGKFKGLDGDKVKNGLLKLDGVVNITDNDGNTLKLSDISPDSVLKVVVPESDNPTFAKITVCKNSFSAKAEAVKVDGDNSYIQFEGKRYDVLKWAVRLMDNNIIPAMTIGRGYKVYLDGEKVVAWSVDESLLESVVGYILRAGFDDSVYEGRYILKILTEYNEIEEFMCNDKVRINGGNKVQADSEYFKSLLINESGTIRQLVKYKLNNKGEISELEFAEDFPDDNPKKGSLYKVSDVLPGLFTKKELRYYRSSYGGLDAILYNISKDVKMFKMPKSEKYKEDDRYYSVVDIDGMQDYNSAYAPVAYTTLGEYNNVNYLISEVDTSNKVNDKINATMISKVEMIVDDNDERWLRIYGMRDGKEVSFKADYRDYPNYKRLTAGDVVQYAENVHGFVDLGFSEQFKLCLDYDPETKTLSEIAGGWVFEYGHWMGIMYKVHKIENGMMYLNRPNNIGSERFNAVLPYGTINNYVFYSNRGIVTRGSVEEAVQYVSDPDNASSVFVVILDGNMAGIFLYK